MANRDPSGLSGFALDVWGDDVSKTALTAELAGHSDLDPEQAAHLYYELGRLALAAGDEARAAQRLLRAYTLRPQFRPTLWLASQLYRERGDYKLLVKLLDAEARATKDPLTRAALLRRRGRLLWLRLDQTGAARAALDEARRLDAADLATLKLIEMLDVVEGNAEGQRDAIAAQVSQLADEQVRAALLVDLARLQAPTDLASAIDTLREAAEIDPDGLPALLELERIYTRAERHLDLVDVLLRQSGLPNTSARWQARLTARAARVQRDQLDDGEAAARLFARATAIHPDFAAAADHFQLLLARGEIAEAAKVGQRLFELDDDSQFRATLACQLGDLHRLTLGDAREAIRWYEKCLGWAPSYQVALETLGDLLGEAGRIDELLQVHRAELVGIEEGQARAQRLYRVATLLERHDRAQEATEVHREALAAAPGFVPSAAALERLLTRWERWDDLVQLYQQELARPHDPDREVYLLETMASVLYHRLGNAERAIDCYRRVLDHAPDNLSVIRAMARLCAEARRWRDLVDLNQREVELVLDPQRNVELMQRSGEIWEHELLDLDRAIECYRTALTLNPEHLPSLRALGRLYRQKGRWGELCLMHEAETQVTTDPEQVIGLLSTIAEIYGEELLDEGKAAATYREILRRKPTHLPAITELSRIHERHNEWSELAGLLESTLEVAPDLYGKALRLWRIGAIREAHLADHAGAIRDYARALRLQPTLIPAQAAYARLLELTDDQQQLAEHLATRLAATEEPDQRAALATHLAELADERTDNPRKAAQLFERACADIPTAWSLWSLVQIYERLGLQRELSDALIRLADLIDDPRAAAECHLRVARIKQQHEFGDAVPHFTRAMSLRSGKHYAQRAMERYLRQRQSVEELAELLLARADQCKDPMELACLWSEIGDLAIERDDAAGAEQAFREALNHSRAHLPAIWALGRLLERQSRWAERAQLAEEEAAVAESIAGVADALTQAAVLWQDTLGDPQRAVPLYQRVLEVSPTHTEAYQRLHDIMQAAEQWHELSSLIRNQINSTTEQQSIVGLFGELGLLYLDRLQQVNKGTACLRRVLELDQFNLEALTRLGDIHYQRGEWTRAGELYGRLELVVDQAAERGRIRRRLGEIFLSAGDPQRALEAFRAAAEGRAANDPELLRRIVEAAEAAHEPSSQASALERLAECTDDADERVHARKQLAIISAELLEDDPRAITALQEVLVLDPLDLQATERLAAIYGRTGNRSAVTQHLRAAVAHHRAELARRPFDTALYEQLGRIFRWQRQYDHLYCSYTLLAQLASIDEVEAQFWREHHQRCGQLESRALPPDRYEALVVPDQLHGPLRTLLRDAGPAMSRAAAADPTQHGLTRGDRVGADHPMLLLLKEMSALFGGLELELWISQADPDLITGQFFGAPAIVVGSRVANSPLAAAERFRLGRELFLLSENAVVLRNRPPREIRILLAALGALAQPQCTVAVADDEATEAARLAKSLARALRRRDRKLLGSTLPAISQLVPRLDLGAFARALREGANRAGLALASDPLGALEDAVALCGQHTVEFADLLLFMVSEEHFALRRELGIAPKGGDR